MSTKKTEQELPEEACASRPPKTFHLTQDANTNPQARGLAINLLNILQLSKTKSILKIKLMLEKIAPVRVVRAMYEDL